MLETIETIVFAIKLYRKYSSSLFQQRSCSIKSSDSQNGCKSSAIWAGVIDSQEFPEQIPEPLPLSKLVKMFPASLNILEPKYFAFAPTPNFPAGPTQASNLERFLKLSPMTDLHSCELKRHLDSTARFPVYLLPISPGKKKTPQGFRTVFW